MFITFTSQEEVLVTSTDQKLVGGVVTKQLVEAAGPGLSQECKRIAAKPIPIGDVVTTGAYNLMSKHVLHVVLPVYDGAGGNSEKVIVITF